MREPREVWRQEVGEVLGLEEGAVWMDGFDECVVGSVERFGMEPVLAYDLDAVIGKLVRKGEGMTLEEAWEWWSVNMRGAWVGEMTPAFVRMLDRREVGAEAPLPLGL